MDEQEIVTRLTEIFKDVFDDDALVIKSNMTARDVANWDSLSHVRMILTVEKQFGIRFSSAAVGSISNAGELIEMIKSYEQI